MSKMSLRRAMMLRMNAEKEEMRKEIVAMNKVMQDHIKLENRIRHLPREEFDRILSSSPDLLKELEQLQYDMEEADANRREPEERSATPNSHNEQLPDGTGC